MQLNRSMNKSTVRHKLILTAMTIYIIVFYPLIYQAFADSSLLATFNKLALFGLLLLFVVVNRQFINRVTANQTNKLLLLSLVYMAFSLLLYSPNLSMQDAAREMLYVFVPILFFYIFEMFEPDEQAYFMNVVIWSLLAVIGVGVLNLVFGIVLPIGNMQAALTHHGVNFQSYYSAMEMGYVIQLLFAMTLFRLPEKTILTRFRAPFLIVLFILGVLTLQRGCYMGLGLAIIFYLISNIKYYFTLDRKAIIAFIANAAILILAAVLLVRYWYEFTTFLSKRIGVDIKKFVRSELTTFRLNDVMSDRTEQAKISNTDNLFHFLFGEGFAKYSPNNRATIRKMPDASYYRIFDELGLIGFFVFFIPYVLMIWRAFKSKRVFALYCILETFIAFFFNRILWMIPLNFIIYPMFSMTLNKKSCFYPKQIPQSAEATASDNAVKEET